MYLRFFPLLLVGVLAVACSSQTRTEPEGTPETTQSAGEALTRTGPKSCGPCGVLNCQYCGPEDGCIHPKSSCICDMAPDGDPCTDGNKCDLPSTCSGGSCVYAGQVTCPAPDECHVGVCNQSTGGCTSQPAPDGTPCGPLGANTCSAGTCVVPCGLMTCASQNMSCGLTGDGCGHVINCGTCTAPETCGGGGVPSVCGAPSCTKVTCAYLHATCGMQADGCGGLQNCGSCPWPQTCGGGGVNSACGSSPKCVPKTCADYPAGTCGQQADGCGGVTPDCHPCASPETCGGAGVLDHCGYCGGFGYGPCPGSGCNSGAIDDGQGHCVQCNSLGSQVTVTRQRGEPFTPNWNVEVDYSTGLPSAASFSGVVEIVDGATGARQSQAVQGLSGKATFAVPMLTSESNNIFATLRKAGDPACDFTHGYPVEASVSWKDPTLPSICGPGQAPNFTTQGGGSRGGPVFLVPLLWGFNDQAFSDNLNAVYWQFRTSNYYAWLRREYGAPELHHSYPQNVPASTTSGSVSDQLDSFIRNGQVPNTGNIVYIVHLAPGTVVSKSNLGTICVSNGLYAYNTMDSDYDLFGGTNTYYYVVVPDPTTVCYGTVLGQNAFTAILTHEIAENLTDPDGSTGWEDKSCGSGPQSQIGDLCVPPLPLSSSSNLVATISTPYYNAATGNNFLTVQKLWSNKMDSCVTEDAPAVPFN